ncbi:glutamate--tRNA ligase [Spongiibacter sp. UBA1325]|jgi:glutamyl-tRNA synthetase|uniref:glutamate--tRNA ligase n=1 Tax=Spongiibacter sp. UBA1325 TaxID=1947543 RepID=UPI00257D9222|nr:glutamate--tRNA ligase [Spongiibacter sp. UBA1325]|tara:strand:+ start:2405 stop:3889 length:1485 start_codon:yes stop_codon:yes gene_type:complete
MTVRTRIAPSPTGDPHVGTAYIALFNYCFAKSLGGQFLLRIEDTDQQRSTPESEQAILDSLRWLGLDWDEGPDVGGQAGPYRQSERSEIYREHCEQLIAKGLAFRCYRSPEELDALREARRAEGQHTALKPSDLRLSDDEQQRREAEGMPYVIRMVVPEEAGRCEIEDMLRGTVELDWGQVDAQILLKSDGLPTYHLANVVDDHLMGITHVLRGEEWLNSAPKHKLLYEYFGWEMPQLCHLPLLRNPDKSKLSKRKNPTSILYYQRMGFLPEALLNYLGRMGWSMPDEREKFSLQTMIEHFDIQRVSLGGPIFDVEKLRWLNGLWLREDLSDDALIERLQSWALNRETLTKMLPHLKQRIEVFTDIAPLAGFFLSGMLPLSKESFAQCTLEEEQLVEVLQCCLWRLEAESDWQRDTLFADIKALVDGLELRMKDVMPPLFIAIAGTTASISVVDSMEILGPEISRARIRHAIDILGGVGKKKLKKLEKRYQQLP